MKLEKKEFACGDYERQKSTGEFYDSQSMKISKYFFFIFESLFGTSILYFDKMGFLSQKLLFNLWPFDSNPYAVKVQLANT